MLRVYILILGIKPVHLVLEFLSAYLGTNREHELFIIQTVESGRSWITKNVGPRRETR